MINFRAVFSHLGSPLLLPQLHRLLSHHNSGVFSLLLRAAHWELMAAFSAFALVLSWIVSKGACILVSIPLIIRVLRMHCIARTHD
jgi:hypothetical protein